MRIIGGIAAGKILMAPPGLGVRPTPDKVKQAIFNSLGDRCRNSRVLDLFAGSGALGLEALSRGAARIISIERSPLHARFYRENLRTTQLPVDQVKLCVGDVFAELFRLASADEQFDLVFADPPYGSKNIAERSNSLAQQLLDAPPLPGIVSADGIFILGHTKRDALQLPAHWAESRQLKHGDSIIRILKVSASDEASIRRMRDFHN